MLHPRRPLPARPPSSGGAEDRSTAAGSARRPGPGPKGPLLALPPAPNPRRRLGGCVAARGLESGAGSKGRQTDQTNRIKIKEAPVGLVQTTVVMGRSSVRWSVRGPPRAPPPREPLLPSTALARPRWNSGASGRSRPAEGGGVGYLEEETNLSERHS